MHQHLQFLKDLRGRKRNKVLQKATSKQIGLITKLSRKLLKRGGKLKPYKRQLRYLTDRKRTPKQKKRFLIQRGGFILPALISAAIPIISSLLSK